MVDNKSRTKQSTLKIKLSPRSSKNEISGFEGDILRVRVKSPPVEGKANRDLVNLLAKRLGIPKGAVEIVSGHKSKLKTIRLKGVNPAEAHEHLQA